MTNQMSHTAFDIDRDGVLLAPHPLLRVRCEPVPEALFGLARAVAEAMREIIRRRDAAGLAANQIGWGRRMLMLRVGLPRTMVNPTLEAASPETDELTEGCLSLPGQFFRVKRPTWVIAAWTGLDGEARRDRLTGFEAAAFCHELDHLDGVLVSDHGEPTESPK